MHLLDQVVRICDVQGFGKRKSAVGMPRPKKKKVVLLEEESEELPMAADDNGAEDGVPSPTDIKELELEPPAVPESPGKQQRLEAEDDYKFACEEASVAAVVLAEQKSKLLCAERLYQAKMKRWDAAERRKERPSAILQLERLYKSKIQLMEAQMATMAAQLVMEEADGAAFACHINVKTLEINRLRREVRRYKKNVGSRARSCV